MLEWGGGDLIPARNVASCVTQTGFLDSERSLPLAVVSGLVSLQNKIDFCSSQDLAPICRGPFSQNLSRAKWPPVNGRDVNVEGEEGTRFLPFDRGQENCNVLTYSTACFTFRGAYPW